MTTTEEAPSWARGYPLAHLEQHAAIFAAHDQGLVRGAFSKVNESKVAEWLAAGRLREGVGVRIAYRELERPTAIRDFRGERACVLPARTLLLDRVGYRPEDTDYVPQVVERLCRDYGTTAAAWMWSEHGGDRQVAYRLGWRPLAYKVSGAAELRTLWGPPKFAGPRLPDLEWAGLRRLDLPLLDVWPLAARLDMIGPTYAEHYSSYNLRRSWSALALRGFGGRAADIEKPAEMGKRWKADHPWRLREECVDTGLRRMLPEAEPLIDAIPGHKERIRLMVVGAGGGLARHADITDPDAGASDGRLLRIHIPLVTNSDVRFTSWGVDGSSEEATMKAGEAWYLDTRKPHAASNGGGAERIHLVCDTWWTPELADLLR